MTERTILTPELAKVAADAEIKLFRVKATTRFEQGTDTVAEGEIIQVPKSLRDKYLKIGYAEAVED